MQSQNQAEPVSACRLEQAENVDSPTDDKCGETFLLSCSLLFTVVTFPISLFAMFKSVREYERAVIFRLGRIKKGKPLGPGVFTTLPCADSIRVIDLRTKSFDVPSQEILTKDGVTVKVDAVVFYHVFDPIAAVKNVADYDKSARLLAQTALRNTLGTKTLAELLTEGEAIKQAMRLELDSATVRWGVDVQRVEITDVQLPQNMRKSMAAEAEAQREARAKIISADGEQRAARSLKEAADIMNESPVTLHLRYLQTLRDVSSDKSSTIVFPIPIELMSFATKIMSSPVMDASLLQKQWKADSVLPEQK